MNTEAEAKIRMLKNSLRCFVCGLLGLLPVIGLPFAITALVSYWVLAGAGRVRQVMGETGIRILVRIMGLLLVALAMQLFINGLTDLGVLTKQ